MLVALIETSEAEGVWTLQAEVMAENKASCALHRKCGFREVGYRERIGHINNVWHDVILFERRSKIVGGPNLATKKCDKQQVT